MVCSLTSITPLHKVLMQARLWSSSTPQSLVREMPTRMPCQMHLSGGLGAGMGSEATF